MINIRHFHSPFGELILGSFEGKLCLCDWRYRKNREAIDRRIQDGLDSVFAESESDVIAEAEKQLNEYFSGLRNQFDLPLLMVGTDFRKRVWNELLKIPYGKTETYFGMSAKLGNTLAIRAIAAANGANALSIIVPCHRVIGSNGEMTGYAGGVAVKRKLLQLEGSLSLQHTLPFTPPSL